MIDKKTFDKLQQQLLIQEGFRNKPYQDTKGYWTVGIGWNLESTPITKEQALYINADHIQYFDDQLHNKLPFYDELDEVRKAVLINMAFNLGLFGLMAFKKFLNLLSTKQFAQASIEMLDSAWAKQVKNRALVLSQMIKTGEWPD